MVEYNENVTINAPYKLILKNTDSWWVELRCLQNAVGAPGILEVNNHIKCLKDIAAYGGALMTASAPGSTGGGAINMGHAWESSTDPPRINMTDAGYHTLYITAGSSVGGGVDAVLADMKLKNLTAKVLHAVGSGSMTETALGTDNARMGVTDGTPRVIFEDAGYTQWEIDNCQGKMRFFTPGVAKFEMVTTGFNPSAANTFGCGSGSNYWAGVVTQTIYRRYESSFDALDDLGLVKNYKTKKIVEKAIERDVIDMETLPHLKRDPTPDDPALANFWDENKVSGFLLGCVKKLVLRMESLEAEIKNLKS